MIALVLACAPVPGAKLGFGEPPLSDERLADCVVDRITRDDGVVRDVERWVYNDVGHRVVADLRGDTTGAFAGREVTEFAFDLPVRSSASTDADEVATWEWTWRDGQRIAERYFYEDLDVDVLYTETRNVTWEWSDERIQRTQVDDGEPVRWRWSLDRMSATANGVHYAWDHWGNLISRGIEAQTVWQVDDEGRITAEIPPNGPVVVWDWRCP